MLHTVREVAVPGLRGAAAAGFGGEVDIDAGVVEGTLVASPPYGSRTRPELWFQWYPVCALVIWPMTVQVPLPDQMLAPAIRSTSTLTWISLPSRFPVSREMTKELRLGS